VTTIASLRYEYATAFEAYLAEPSESALRAAYELGRDAVARELSVLDLAAVHHDAVQAALAHADAAQVADAGGQFFLESLSAFEMLQRGFREAQDAARAEQRQAAALRQLSSFLGDASLTLEEAGSIEEMLQLVAEQARDLIGADCCIAYAAVDDDVRVEAVSGAWADVADRTTLFRLASLLRGRLSQSELADDPAAVALGGVAGRPLRGLLAAPLTALDGRELGAIHLFDPPRLEFTDVDEARLLHLTQLASAALERVTLYGRGRRVGDALRCARHGEPTLDVVIQHRASETGSAVWFDAVHLADGRVAVVAGEVRGPAPAVAAAQARAAACALLAAGAEPDAVVTQLAALLERLAPDNPARAAAAVVDGERAETCVDGAGRASFVLGDGATLVVRVGGGGPPAVAVEGGGAGTVLPERGDGEAAVLTVRRIVRAHP
jgi:Phosphoserine phosphatase RsbU, N-terminal domain/GAF domain